MTPLVFVHGNPETADIWDNLAAMLRRAGRTEQLRLSPPGFGAPVPRGFEPRPRSYAIWLANELALLGEPADVIGHDWGGAFTVIAAAACPGHFRSWASDALGLFHPDYVWHELAQLWQTAGDGETWVNQTLATPTAQFATALAARGMPHPTAARVAPAFDAATGNCILRLYRAARQPAMAQLGRGLGAAATRPGLGIVALDDRNAGTAIQRREMGAALGAEVVDLPGAGHWWMTNDNLNDVTAALAKLWSKTD